MSILYCNKVRNVLFLISFTIWASFFALSNTLTPTNLSLPVSILFLIGIFAVPILYMALTVKKGILRTMIALIIALAIPIAGIIKALISL